MNESNANPTPERGPNAPYLHRCTEAGEELSEAARRIAAAHRVAPFDALDAAQERLAPAATSPEGVTVPEDVVALFDEPGDVLRLVDGEGCYAVTVVTGPSRARCVHLFGTDTVPLPYAPSVEPDAVLAHLKRHKPRATVLDGTCPR